MMKRIVCIMMAGWLGLALFAGRAEAVSATGGTVTNYTDAGGTNWTAHIFTNSGTFSNYTLSAVEVLVVGGGGGGGDGTGGGGGAGGYVYTNLSLDAGGNYAVVVGAGGLGGTGGYGTSPGMWGQNGSNSVFGGLTAFGGGGGAPNGGGQNGKNGGSGGGGSESTSPSSAGLGTNGQGNAGGYATAWSSAYGTGGGGGAGSAGSNGTSSVAGPGGNGRQNSISGEATWYAGGGGGGIYGNESYGVGGSGIGGHGGGSSTAATSGKSSTGSGGGGQGGNRNSAASSHQGGSGIVIVRYVAIDPNTPTIRNDAVTAVTTNSATFNGTLVSTGSSACAVCVLWGTDPNAWANTNWFNGGAVNETWTNNTPFSTNITLSQGTTYYYTYGASNATTNVVASGPVSVTTISLPSVTNLGAQARRTWARLNGQVLSTGGETPTCRFEWWQDGSPTTNTVPKGTQSGVFSTDLSTLTAGTTYGYLVTASNSAGVVTSEARGFTTLGSGPVAWYAATNGTETACTDWSTAATNLQTVLDLAASNDTIYVAGHTFGLTNQLVWTTSYLTVRGGYAATNAADQPGTNNPALWPTVIRRASGNTRILYVNGVTNGILDQVTIAGGNVVGAGGGVRFNASTNFLLSGSVVQSNAFSAFMSSGAGVYVSANSAITVSNCVIRKNTGQDPNSHPAAAATGGGIYSAGTLMLRDSLILQNEVTTRGWRGGGIHINGGRAHVINCLIDGNKALNTGSGLQIDAGTARIENCSIVSHIGEGLRQAGGTVGVTNCIFWGNTTDTNGVMTVSHSLIGTDPLFEFGYYLGAGSPATNAGSDTAANLGLQNYAKNAAGATYGAAETVNMGYHYKTGADMTYADIYVAPGGDDSHNGTNALTPFKTMTKALATAMDGTRIHVATGTYSVANGETFPLTLSGKTGVKILGTNAALTVFDAVGSSARVLGLSDADYAVIEGVALKRGAASGSGGGLRIENSANGLLSGAVVESNTCTSSSVSGGGGIYVAADGVLTVTNCVIRNNVAEAPGGGTRYAYGGGLYSAGALTMIDSQVARNESEASGAWTGGGFGGGLYFSGARLDLRNVLVAGNNASDTGDGLYAAAGTVTLTNVTVAGNSGEGLRRTAGTVSVKDSILWGNGVDSAGGVTLAWTCYSNSTDHVDGGSNITVNPLFVDTTYYHLQSRAGNYTGGYFSGGTWGRSSSNSPCLDAGDPGSAYAREPQPHGKRVNMGCYGNTEVAALSPVPQGTLIMFR